MIEGNAARRASLRFTWRTSPQGNQWLKLTRSEAVIVYFWKAKKSWSYFTDADGTNPYRNGFETQLEAMLAAEEDWGDRVLVDERQQSARKPTPNLRAVKPKAEIPEIELEAQQGGEPQVVLAEPAVDAEPQTQAEPQPEVEPQPEETPDTLSARSRDEYGRTLYDRGSSTWEHVLYHCWGSTKSLSEVAAQSGISLEQVVTMLDTAYDKNIVEITISKGFVKVNLKEEEASA